MNAKRVDAWICGECGIWHTEKKQADICCVPKNCYECGDVIPRFHVPSICRKCELKRVYDYAKKMTVEEYQIAFPNHPFYYDGEYYDRLEDLLDYIDSGECKTDYEYIYGASLQYLEVDSDYVLQNALDGFEEFDFYDVDSFHEFVEEWNAKNRIPIYILDTSIIVNLEVD